MLWRCKSVKRCISYASFQKVISCLGKWKHGGNHSVSHFSIFWIYCGRLEPWPRMTQVFYLLALRFICLFFSSVLAQVEVDRSLFRLNIFPSQCCHLFSQRCLLHSLDLIFKLPAWFSSQSTCVLIPPPLVRTSEGCQKGFVLRVSSLNPDVFNLFLSHLTSNRYFCRTLASSIRKQLVFVHLPYWNQVLLPIPAIFRLYSLLGKDCMTGKHWHAVLDSCLGCLKLFLFTL